MRTAQLLNDVVRWRWAPSAGLAAGALGYVIIAALAVPDRIDLAHHSRLRPSIGEQAVPAETGEAPPPEPVAMERSSPLPASPPPVQTFGPRGFSPVERREPEPPPPPPSLPSPPPPEPPPPPAAMMQSPPPTSEPDDDSAAEHPEPTPSPPSGQAPGAQGGAGPGQSRAGPFRRIIAGHQVQRIAEALVHDGGAGGAPAPPPQ